MSDPDDQSEADRWAREASEELRAARVIAEHDEIPDRVAGFHAHLAAEKAMKALLIRRDVVLLRIHDLVELQRLLPNADGDAFDLDDLELLNPWTIDGRYPADVGHGAAGEAASAVEAAGRIVEIARDRSARGLSSRSIPRTWTARDRRSGCLLAPPQDSPRSGGRRPRSRLGGGDS